MSVDWDFVSALIAILALIVAMFAGGLIGVVTKAYHWYQLRSPHHRKCDTLFWHDIPASIQIISTAPANSVDIRISIYHGHHVGAMDWHLAMMDMFRVYCQCARRVRAADKPLVLIERGLKETFVRTDYHFFMALIFGMVYCTYDAMGLLARQRQRASSKLDIGGVIVHVRRYKSDRDTSIIVLKFETRAWKRLLTKLEVERLAAGYPPFYREQVSIRPDAAVRPIQSEDDVARGGWVVAAGFSRMDPVPLYIDVRPFRRRCSRTESGGVFWRSFERVKAILAGPISEAFPDDDDVKQVLDAVTYMIKIESDSGGMSYISRSPLWGLDMSSLTQEQYAMAVQLYNGPPRVTQEEVDSIREKFQPILGYVLMAAFLGVEKCLKYVKNPGREMERILPQGVDTASELYLLGC